MDLPLPEPMQKALDAQNGGPLRLIDPRTNEPYVLIRAEAYQQQSASPSGPEPGVPPGIRQSREAFLRNLAHLLREYPGDCWWAGYEGNELLGVARTQAELLRECHRRGLAYEQYYVGLIRPYGTAEEEEEIERFYEYEDEDEPTEPRA